MAREKKESLTIEGAKAALEDVHGIINPTDRQIAMFVLFGIVEREA